MVWYGMVWQSILKDILPTHPFYWWGSWISLQRSESALIPCTDGYHHRCPLPSQKNRIFIFLSSNQFPTVKGPRNGSFSSLIQTPRLSLSLSPSVSFRFSLFLIWKNRARGQNVCSTGLRAGRLQWCCCRCERRCSCLLPVEERRNRRSLLFPLHSEGYLSIHIILCFSILS